MNPLTKIISRKDALARGETHYFTGLPCKHGHLSLRTVAKYACLSCPRARDSSPRKLAQNRAWKAGHKAQERARQATPAYKEKKRASGRAYYLANRAAVLARTGRNSRARRLAQAKAAA